MASKLFLRIFVFLFILLLIGCESSDDEETRSDCFPDRDIIKEATNEIGRVGILDQNHPDVWSIASMKGIIGHDGPTYDSRDVIVPCELPEEFREEGLMVEFSGTLLDAKDDFPIVSNGFFCCLELYYVKLNKIEVVENQGEE